MQPDNVEPTKKIADNRADRSLLPEPQGYADQTEVLEEKTLRLLEEKLVVNRTKHKVGEVIVRKEVETRMVQVPVRSEKLIVEQVGAENKPLAEIKLSEGMVSGVESIRSGEGGYTARGEFISLQAASNILKAIATNKMHGCKKVRVELVLEDSEHQQEYQTMLDRCTKR